MNIEWILPLLNSISPYWLTIWIIIFQQFLINKRENRIDELIKVNQEHNISIKELTFEISKLNK